MKLIIDHSNLKIGNGGNAFSTNFDATTPEFASFDVSDFQGSGDNPRNDTESTRVILDTFYAPTEHWSIKDILTHEKTAVDRVFGSRELLEVRGAFTNNFFDENIDTASLRLTCDYNNISGVIGAYYFNAHTPSINTNEVLLNTDVIAATQGCGFVKQATSGLVNSQSSDTTTTNKAFFAQVLVDLTDSLILDLGIRYDDEQFENTGFFDVQRDCSATARSQI